MKNWLETLTKVLTVDTTSIASVSGRVLALCAGGPGFNPWLRPDHTKDVKKMVPVVPLFSTQH